MKNILKIISFNELLLMTYILRRTRTSVEMFKKGLMTKSDVIVVKKTTLNDIFSLLRYLLGSMLNKKLYEMRDVI